MLHILGFGSPHAPDGVLRGMFAARKSIFVDLLHWDLPVIDSKYEVDQFDDQHATYLVLTDCAGGHLGSTRLLPTTRPHILDSFYADLCEDAPPRGPRTAEITRFCLDRRLRAADRRKVRDTLVTALVDHALATGLTNYSAIAELGWFQQILAFGWRCRPLGLPRTVDGQTLAALGIEIDRDTPQRLAAANIQAMAAIGNARAAA